MTVHSPQSNHIMNATLNNCFFCLRKFNSPSKHVLMNVASTGRSNNNNDLQNRKPVKVLLEYLLGKGNTNVTQDILMMFEGMGNGGDNQGLNSDDRGPGAPQDMAFSYESLLPTRKLQFCQNCNTVIRSVEKLHQELEIIQMKIVELVKRLRQVILNRSKLHECLDANTEGCDSNTNIDDHWTNSASSNRVCLETERKLLEVLHTFQGAVFETGLDFVHVPCVVLQKSLNIEQASLTRHGSSMQKEKQSQQDCSSSGELEKVKAVVKTEKAETHGESKNEGRCQLSFMEHLENSHPCVDIEDQCTEKVENELINTDKNDKTNSNPSPPINKVSKLIKARDNFKREMKAGSKSATMTMNNTLHKLSKRSIRKKQVESTPGGTRRKYSKMKRSTKEICTKTTLRKSRKVIKSSQRMKAPRQKPTFTCESCPSTWSTKSIFKFECHLRQHETMPKRFACERCPNLYFSGKQLYNFHKAGHERYTLLCDVCNKRVDHIFLTKHMESVHGPVKAFPCANCSYCTSIREKYLEHLRHHDKSGKVFCDICSLEIPTRHKLIQHLYDAHQAIERLFCSQKDCQVSFLDTKQLWEHERTHNTMFECSYCGKNFTSVNSLKQHEKRHAEIKQFSCDQCEKTFADKTTLTRHTINLHGAEKFQCSFCDRKYRDHSALKNHLRVHDGSAYPCDQCGKMWVSPYQLRRHMAVHSNERNFVCEQCGKEFGTKGNLATHKKTHNTEKKFKCSYCGKDFLFKKYLLTHLRTHTGERPYVCDICGASFTQAGPLHNHKRKHDCLSD